jgi:demethylmenaquinone methyltransferase/2-methoxy-6-polyprenyl-1,4-benzoquinol methylase
MIPYPYKSDESKKQQITKMFNHIAFKYDFLNHILSLYIDKLWRKRTVKILRGYLSHPANEILDVATGTGPFVYDLQKLNPQHIVGIDIAKEMLLIAEKKIQRDHLSNVQFIHGDAENMPFKENQFDLATVAFGVRNFEDINKGIAEINRILNTGGTLAILELTVPKTFPVKQFYWLYARLYIPVVGRLFSKDDAAYSYLPKSIKEFSETLDIKQILSENGFDNYIEKKLSCGIATLFLAQKTH